MADLAFSLDIRRPESRRIEVVLEFDRDAWSEEAPDADASGPSPRTLFLPAWTPGSYLIREFARQLGPVVAADAATGASLECVKVAKNRYRVQVPRSTARVRICYSVYAHELTVRTADLTPDHAFWNHACVLLWPVAQPVLSASIGITAPAGWEIECALPKTLEGQTTWLAAGIDAAMDSPVLAGTLGRLDLTAGGVIHRVVMEGLAGIEPPAGFVDDLTRVCEKAIEVFGEVPYPSYTFLCLFTDAGHGGLEHRDGSVLLGARTALRPGKTYQQFLGLAAHELFHAWNVKRMRPVELWTYDYEVENHTTMLWLAEGFTAYYDDLLCLRAGVLEQSDYLAILARNLTSMLSGHGRQRQSLAESSFDAWIRFYRPDENTRNATQNYYVNGSLVALVLDLTIRKHTGERCLDHALRSLWINTYKQGRGYRRADVEAALSEAAGQDLAPLVAKLVDGPLQPDLEPLLGAFGLEIQHKEQDKPYLGIGFKDGTTAVSFVSEDGPAWLAGIAPGDEVIALASLRVTHESWTEVFQSTALPGRPLSVLTSSRGTIRERTVTPSTAPVGTVSIAVAADAGEEQKALRRGWLGS